MKGTPMKLIKANDTGINSDNNASQILPNKNFGLNAVPERCVM
jgi:hypothetical protein